MSKSTRPSGAASSVVPMHRLRLVLGTTEQGPVVLEREQAAAHKLLLAVTGMGKSKLLVALGSQVMNQRASFVLIDTHGDACDAALTLLIDQGFYRDPRAYERLLYVDLTRDDAFPALNALANAADPHKVASFVFEAMTRVWPDLGGGAAPMIANYVQYGTYVLALHQQPLTMLPRLLTDADYRGRMLSTVSDPVVRDFFARMDTAGTRSSSQVESTLRRIALLSFNPTLRFTLGQAGNILPWRAIMDAGVSVLFNCGGREAEVVRLLAALQLTSIEEAALSRFDLPEERRSPCHVLCDEFSQYAARTAQTMERVLALTRKYSVSLLLCTQTLGSIPHELRAALQNTTLLSLRVGADDAPWCAERLLSYDPKRLKHSAQGTASYQSAAEQTAELARELMSLPPRTGLARLGEKTLRFQTLTIPTPRCTPGQLQQVKDTYAGRLLTSRRDLEAREARAYRVSQPSSAQAAPAASAQSNAASLPLIPSPPAPHTSGPRRIAPRKPVRRPHDLDGLGGANGT